MRRQPEAFAEHSREVVFGQRTQRRQLAEADGIGQVAVDVIHQQPPLMSGQAAFEAKSLALADLAEQQVVEQVMGQAGGQQAFPGFVPVQRDQLAKAMRLSRVVEECLLVQLHLPRFAVQ